MARQILPLDVIYTPGSVLYAVIHGILSGAPVVWNPTLLSGFGDWEAYNSAHWAQYAIPVTEQTGSGYYAAVYPAHIVDVLTSEVFYAQGGGSPALGDAPAILAHSQGVNAQGVGADAVAADNLQAALASEQTGVAAGVPTASVVPSSLINAQANAYAGRVCLFTTGAAAQCAARIVAYAVTNGVLTFAAPLPVAPAAGDKFVIV